MEGYTERVCKLIEKEKDKLCLLGWSLGSLLAIDAAGKYKDRVEKLVLVGGTARFTRDKETGYFCGWHKSAVKKMKEAIKVHREKQWILFILPCFFEGAGKQGICGIVQSRYRYKYSFI